MATIKKIILVEDNLADVELVKISIRELTEHIELLHVGDGQELLAFLQRRPLNQIGVILLDLNMPRVSGFDVLRYLQNDATLKKIPVVMFTTSSSASDIAKCYDLGAKAFVCKPLDIFDFNHCIHSIVDFWARVNMTAIYS